MVVRPFCAIAVISEVALDDACTQRYSENAGTIGVGMIRIPRHQFWKGRREARIARRLASWGLTDNSSRNEEWQAWRSRDFSPGAGYQVRRDLDLWLICTPVEMIIGFAVSAQTRIKGRNVLSPEETLIAST